MMAPRKLVVMGALLALAAAAGPGAALGKERRCIDPKTRVATDICPPEAVPTPASAVEIEENLRQARITAEALDAERRARRQLLEKYPDEATFYQAERAELAPMVAMINLVFGRLADLLAQRKALESEAEFYRGKPKPLPLQRALDASDAQFLAQAQIFRDRQADVASVVAKYAELSGRLHDAWSQR